MNILQVIRSIGFGGAENHVLQLSLGLRERGHQITVVCPDHSWVAEQCRAAQIPVAGLAMRGLFDLASYWKLHRLIQTCHAEIVHAHQVRPSQYVGIAVKGTPAIALSTAHSTNARKHMRRMQHIIAVSDAVAANLLANNYPRDRITRIYNGVADIPYVDRAKLRHELGLDDKEVAVVCAGRFIFDKGQDVLVAAAALCPDSIRFFLIGDPNTAFGREVKAKAGDNVHFLGYRNDVPRLLPAFDLYAAPSRREAFSLSLIEAAAARLPIVGSFVGGIPEMVSDGQTGILVAANEPAALANALRLLAANQQQRRLMGEQARQRYEQQFTLAHMVDETEALYYRLRSTSTLLKLKPHNKS